MPRTQRFLIIPLLAFLLAGCSPRPPSWPPDRDKLAETSSWLVDAGRFCSSAHGSLSCDECHPDIALGDPGSPHPDTTELMETATELYDYSLCGTCHPEALAAYGGGVHAEAMADPSGANPGNPAPTCGHCHNAHYAPIQTRDQLLVSVSEACGACHPRALEAYHRDYHGKAAILGYVKTATCSDCHGAHTVLALFEAGEAVRACRRCHPGANANLTSYRVHAHEILNPDHDDPRAGEFRLFFWVRLFFTCLLVGVLGFFYAHTGLWFLRSLHERLRRNHDR